MKYTELISRFDDIFRNQIISIYKPKKAVKLYSSGRQYFLDRFIREEFMKKVSLPPEATVKAWGLEFQCGLFNAAGVFKNGHGYAIARDQGAGAYLCGTSTSLPREGNTKHGIRHPFVPLGRSKAALNWMGLPNESHSDVARRISFLPQSKNCPLGASLAADPGPITKRSLEALMEGMEVYEMSGVAFIEMNESCPNVPHEHEKGSRGLDKDLVTRLDFIDRNYLRFRQRRLPVIVKVSNDTAPELIPPLIDVLTEMGYDGINLGNTSVRYDTYAEKIHDKERKVYDWFTTEFGGGLSGKPLKDNSLMLCKTAVDYLKTINPPNEFHVIRTGGVETLKDIRESEVAGVKLNQWFTGYFDAFAKHGHKLYAKLFRDF